MAILVFIAFLVLATSAIEDLFKYHGVPARTWAKLAVSTALFVMWKLLIAGAP